MTDSKPRRLHSVDQIAEYLGVSTKTVRRWIQARQLTAIRAGRQWRVTSEDLSSFLEQRRRGAHLDVR